MGKEECGWQLDEGPRRWAQELGLTKSGVEKVGPLPKAV